MPDIKIPYTSKGEELVEDIKEEVKEVGGNVEYDVINAPDMRENYQLGGLVPGHPGFGQRPVVTPPVRNIGAPLIKPPLGNIETPLGIYEEGGEVEYKKGGKVKK